MSSHGDLQQSEQALGDVTDLRALLAPRVEVGARLLDERRPGWANRISLSNFNIGSCGRCVLGQEFRSDELAQEVYEKDAYELGVSSLHLTAGDFAYGFNLSTDEMDSKTRAMAWPILHALWIEQIGARRKAVTG